MLRKGNDSSKLGGTGPRKPGIRPRLSPASSGSSPSPPARLSPVPHEDLAPPAAMAAPHSACTPPAADLDMSGSQRSPAVPSNALYTRALVKPRKAASPQLGIPLRPTALPPMAPTPAPATPLGGGNEEEDSRMKRDRPVVSAGGRSTGSSSVYMPQSKHRADDGEVEGTDGAHLLAGATAGSSSSNSDSKHREHSTHDSRDEGECVSGRQTSPSLVMSLRVEDVAAPQDENTAGGAPTAQGRDDDDDADRSLAVSPMHRTRVLDDELLRDWTGVEDLDLVYSVELQLDAEKMMGVHELGRKLPSLSSLRLSRSFIPRVRLLGTRYTSLRLLWINSCKVTDLRGIGALAPSLVELYASFNSITDLAPLLDVSATLEVLDVEGNELEDVQKLQRVLPFLHSVTSLNMSGNSVVFRREEVASAVVELGGDGTGSSAIGVFREWVRLLMPKLELLDDTPLTAEEALDDEVLVDGEWVDEDAPSPTAVARPATATAHHVDPMEDALAEELRLLQECIRESESFGDRLGQSLDRKNASLYARPATSCGPGARLRLGSSCGPNGSRAGSSSVAGIGGGRLGSVRSSGTATRLSSASAAASQLTTGGVIAGNAIAGLRKRLLQHPLDATAPRSPTTSAPAAATRSSISSQDEGTPAHHGAAPAVSPPSKVLTLDPAVISLGGGLGSGDDSDSDEGAWDSFRAATLAVRCSTAPASRSGRHSVPPAATGVSETPKYRLLYNKFFGDDDAEGATEGGEKDGEARRGGSTTAAPTGRAGDEMDTIVLKEVSRARAQIAALAAAEADAHEEEEANATDFFVSSGGSAPHVALHPANVLEVEE